jgi:hypothetical protein
VLFRSLVAVLALAAATCARDAVAPKSGGSTKSNGSSHVLLTDGPFPYDRLARVDLYIVSVSASLTTDTAAGGGGSFVTLVSPNRRFDVLALQNGATAELGTLTIPAGAITAVRMVIDTDSSSITLRDGRVLTGGNNGIHWQSSAGRPVLNTFVQEQIFVPDTGAVVVIDFDVGQTFVTLQELDSVSTDSSFTFMPQVRAVDANRTGTITGVVRAHSAGGAPVADASVRLYLGYPVNPENTWGTVATGKTDSTGTFRLSYVTRSTLWASIPALVGATYIVAVDPPSAAGLGRTLVPGITVSAKQTASRGTVVLP